MHSHKHHPPFVIFVNREAWATLRDRHLRLRRRCVVSRTYDPLLGNSCIFSERRKRVTTPGLVFPLIGCSFRCRKDD